MIQMSPAKKTQKTDRKKMIRWSTADINLLIELWADKIDHLRGSRKNNHVYQEMAVELGKNGLGNVTVEDVRVRIHNLKSRYRTEKKNVGTSGGSPSDWPYFEQVNAILGSHAIHNLESLVEDSIVQNGHAEASPDDDDIDQLDEEWLDDELSYHEASQSLSAPSTPAPPQSGSSPAGPSTSTASTPRAETKKKKKTVNFQSEILKRFDILDERINEEEIRMRTIESEMMEQEKKRTNLLEQFVEDAREMKNAFLQFVNSRS